jgi:hypothetical protein
MQEILDAISKGSNCIMTPHFLEPVENFEISDQTLLLHGIYNLGFLGLRNNPDVIKVVEWWCRRMVYQCVIDLEKGLFVDQKWADLFPAFMDRLTILRHPGYNVAYWNISNRKVKFTKGKWYSNNLPLRFFHFSGNKLEDPNVLSRHTPSYNRNNIGDVVLLLDLYREQIFANGYEYYIKQRYSFKWGGEKGVNKHAPEPVQEVNDLEETHPDLLSEKGKSTKPNWLDIILAARSCHGGWIKMGIKTVRIIQTSGIKGLRQGFSDTKTIAVKKIVSPTGNKQ